MRVSALMAVAVLGCAAARVPPPPVTANPTAMCRDGSVSYSRHRSGTCSSHGGVQQWLVAGEQLPRG